MEEVPPGFRFYPTEEELISFYLHHKLEGSKQDRLDRVIPQLDIYDHNPWDLPKFAGDFCRGDPEQWFFFIPMKEKEAQGGRPCRLTDLGYWKATGSQGVVYSSGNNRVIGVKKTMVFYQGRAPTGKKTEWKMNEYRAIEGEASSSTCTAPVLRQEWSLCRVYIKSKCARAFDRRPISGVATSEGTSQVRAHPIHGEDQATDHPSHPKLPSIIETMNSPEQSFSSGDSASNPYRNMEIDNRNADVAIELLWDWKQLNWFD